MPIAVNINKAISRALANPVNWILVLREPTENVFKNNIYI